MFTIDTRTTNQRNHLLLTGPSHAHRLRNMVRSGQLLGIGRDVAGVGGMPIWSRRLDVFRSGYQNTAHMVGDFRFGNAILEQTRDPAVIGDGTQEELAIRRQLISTENDEIMFEAAMQRIETLMAEGQGDRFLFWDLTMREAEARRTGRYRDEAGHYRHPVWNLKNVLDRMGRAAFDTQDALQNARALFIDSSAHPSFLGWHYILNKVEGRDVAPEALQDAFREALSAFWASLREKTKAERVMICGNSKFTRLLEDYLLRGAFFLPDWIDVEPLYTKAHDYRDVLHLFFPADEGHTDVDEEAEAVRRTYGFRLVAGLKKSQLRIVPYDHWAGALVADRGQGASFTPERLEARLADTSYSQNQHEGSVTSLSSIVERGGMVELSGSLHPTVMGLITVFCLAIGEGTAGKARMHYQGTTARFGANLS